MGNIALIKFILHIFIEKSLSKFPSHALEKDNGIGGGRVVAITLLKLPKSWVICIRDNVC